MTDLISALADAAWIEGWLETMYPGTVAHARAKTLTLKLREMVKAKAEQPRRSIKWQAISDKEFATLDLATKEPKV